MLEKVQAAIAGAFRYAPELASSKQLDINDMCPLQDGCPFAEKTTVAVFHPHP